MLLVPRQLERAGMTGNVPYYGGRLTPAHTYAITHPTGAPPPPPAPDQAETVRALQHLLNAKVITPEEYQRLRGRVHR
jgi:hypothetical protein